MLCSIHDVAPRFERQIDRLVDAVQRAQGGGPLAMLVVPCHWGDDPLMAGSDFARRLRGWSDQGYDMFVHGWFHRDDQMHRAAATRWKARVLTASEGEFLGLPRATAAQRMRDGKALIEDITGRAVAGFIAPAWLYGAGAQAALSDAGFALAEDHMRVWHPATQRRLARGPVVTWASRSPMRTLSSLAVAAAARQLKWLQSTVRVAVHPGDTGKAEIMSSIDRTIRAIARTHQPASYPSLLQG